MEIAMATLPAGGTTFDGVILIDGTTGLPYVAGSSGGGSVEVSNFPATQAVSGPLTNAQMTAVTGTAAQTAVTTDPAAAGQTVLAVLRGILAEMQAQTALLQTIADNTAPAV